MTRLASLLASLPRRMHTSCSSDTIEPALPPINSKLLTSCNNPFDLNTQLPRTNIPTRPHRRRICTFALTALSPWPSSLQRVWLRGGTSIRFNWNKWPRCVLDARHCFFVSGPTLKNCVNIFCRVRKMSTVVELLVQTDMKDALSCCPYGYSFSTIGLFTLLIHRLLHCALGVVAPRLNFWGSIAHIALNRDALNDGKWPHLFVSAIGLLFVFRIMPFLLYSLQGMMAYANK